MKMKKTERFVKYTYGCEKDGCSHDTPEEALAHINQQRQEWWDSLTDKQRMRVSRLRAEARAYQAARLAFNQLSTETGGRVQ